MRTIVGVILFAPLAMVVIGQPAPSTTTPGEAAEKNSAATGTSVKFEIADIHFNSVEHLADLCEFGAGDRLRAQCSQYQVFG